MATLDVTEVLLSPEFNSRFQVISASAVVGADGMLVTTNTPAVWTNGVVVPGNGSTMRLADGSRVTSFIDVYTKFPLTQSSKASDTVSTPADVIVWQGCQYTVMRINDFSAYGAGFVHASCDLLTLNPPV